MDLRTIRQLPETAVAQGDDVIAIQADGGQVQRIPLSRVIGRLGPVDLVVAEAADLDVAHDPGILAIVYADPDETNLGYWVKTGANGAGLWVQSRVFSGTKGDKGDDGDPLADGDYGDVAVVAGSIVVQTANGLQIATLDEVTGKLSSSIIPAIALVQPSTVGSQAAQLALSAQAGDVAVRTDQSKTYMHNGGSSGTMADWTELLMPAATLFRPVSFFFTSTPTASEVLLIYVASEAVTFADEFAGSTCSVGTNPTVAFVLTVKKNGAAVGTITISTGGVATFATTGTTVALLAGDRLTVEAPGSADATIANVGITLLGAL